MNLEKGSFEHANRLEVGLSGFSAAFHFGGIGSKIGRRYNT